MALCCSPGWNGPAGGARASIANSFRTRPVFAGCLIRNTSRLKRSARGPVCRLRATIAVFRHWNTAAQNGPVIQICRQCGALLLEDVENCSFCDAPLAESGENSEPVGISVSAPGISHGASDTNDDPDTVSRAQPEWRREVSRRLEAYRVRRGRSRPGRPGRDRPFRAGKSPGAPPRRAPLRPAQPGRDSPGPGQGAGRPAARRACRRTFRVGAQPAVRTAQRPGDQP